MLGRGIAEISTWLQSSRRKVGCAPLQSMLCSSELLFLIFKRCELQLDRTVLGAFFVSTHSPALSGDSHAQMWSGTLPTRKRAYP